MRWTLNHLIPVAMSPLALAALVSAPVQRVRPTEPRGLMVKTAFGPVLGEAGKAVVVFRGLRFAAPPVGALRFRSSVPEVRPALDPAPDCPQLVDIDPTENNNSVMAEDCLVLNVWTPSADSTKRPVMVWVHGGGFVSGSARNTWYDRASLAERGGVVVVSVQYRLGDWGFLDLSEIGGSEYAESGNLGLLDQIAALKWVKQNIAGFGGDPHNITLFRQSAGAGSIGMSMMIPAASGLFQTVILESGTPKEVNDRQRATEVAWTLMKAGTKSIEEL